MLETELYEPVKSFFESQGYIVKAEINDIDVLALKEEVMIAIELKVKISLKHIYQAIERQKIVDNVFLAIPKTTYKSHKTSIKHFNLLLKRLSLGLIIVDGYKIEVMFEPNYYDLDKSKSLNKRRKNNLLENFNNLRKDSNTGGSKGKRMTIYKQNAIEIAKFLAVNPGSSPKVIKQATGVEKTASILQKNFYDWFDKGGYASYFLTKKGLTEYKRFA